MDNSMPKSSKMLNEKTQTILNKKYGYLQVCDFKYFHLTVSWKNPFGFGGHLGLGKSVLIMLHAFTLDIDIVFGFRGDERTVWKK